MDKQSMGARIAKLRRTNGMTQLSLAEQLSVSDKTISKWENGQGYPDITQLPAIAALFGVSIDFLMRGGSRKVQKLKAISFHNDKNRRFINEQYLANGWRIADMKLAAAYEEGGLIALILEKDIFEE